MQSVFWLRPMKVGKLRMFGIFFGIQELWLGLLVALFLGVDDCFD